MSMNDLLNAVGRSVAIHEALEDEAGPARIGAEVAKCLKFRLEVDENRRRALAFPEDNGGPGHAHA